MPSYVRASASASKTPVSSPSRRSGHAKTKKNTAIPAATNPLSETVPTQKQKTKPAKKQTTERPTRYDEEAEEDLKSDILEDEATLGRQERIKIEMARHERASTRISSEYELELRHHAQIMARINSGHQVEERDVQPEVIDLEDSDEDSKASDTEYAGLKEEDTTEEYASLQSTEAMKQLNINPEELARIREWQKQANKDTILIGAPLPNDNNKVTPQMKSTLDLSDTLNHVYTMEPDSENDGAWNLLRCGKVIVTYSRAEREEQLALGRTVLPKFFTDMKELVKKQMENVGVHWATKGTYTATDYLVSQAGSFPFLFTDAAESLEIRSKVYSPSLAVRNRQGRYVKIGEATFEGFMVALNGRIKSQRVLRSSMESGMAKLLDIRDQAQKDHDDGLEFNPEKYELPLSWIDIDENVDRPMSSAEVAVYFHNMMDLGELVRKDVYAGEKAVEKGQAILLDLISTFGAISQSVLAGLDTATKMSPTNWLLHLISPSMIAEESGRVRKAPNTTDTNTERRAKRQRK